MREKKLSQKKKKDLGSQNVRLTLFKLINSFMMKKFLYRTKKTFYNIYIYNCIQRKHLSCFFFQN